MPLQTQFPVTFSRPGINLPKQNLLFLFDPAQGVFTDTALTTRAQNGQSIRGWKDSSGNGHHVTQSGVSTLLPIFRSSVSQFANRPAVEFDGGDYLQRALGASILGGRTLYTVYVVFRYSTASGDRTLWSEGSSSSASPWVNQLVNGGFFRAFHVSDAGVFSSGLLSRTNNINDNVSRIFAFRRTATNAFMTRLNGFEEKTDSTSVAASTTNLLTIGALGRTTIAQQFTGQIALIAAYAANNFSIIEPLLRNYFSIGSAYYSGIQSSFYTIGDSKTMGGNADLTPDYNGGPGYQGLLATKLETATGTKWRELIPRYSAHDGFTTNSIRAAIDADLAQVTGTPAPSFVLINTGANDVVSMPTQTNFKNDLGYIMDACLAKWPSTQVRVMRPWRRSQLTNCNTLATWISEVISTRSSWAAVGPDERVFLENGDDGVTYTADGIHPNHTGYNLTAEQWKTNMGF
jgi:lysophospholipase L1-like esterase